MGGNGQYSNHFQAIGGTELVSKKKTYGYPERDEVRRAAFIAELGMSMNQAWMIEMTRGMVILLRENDSMG